MVYNVYKRATKLLIDDNLVIKYTCLLIPLQSLIVLAIFGVKMTHNNKTVEPLCSNKPQKRLQYYTVDVNNDKKNYIATFEEEHLSLP